jgi:Glycosyl transferase family 2
MELTVGMATYRDFDGVYFTIQALRLYQDMEGVELLVVDNFGCAATRAFVEGPAGGRYVLASELVGTSAPRDLVFREARGEAVLCLDSHVLLGPGVLACLKRYYREHPDCADLLQGPLVYDDLEEVSTHFEPVWRDSMWGVWSRDPRADQGPDAEPFEIPMQGLGCFVARRDSWLGFNPRFHGFGGEEGYLHEKYRQRDRRTLCLPFLRWIHRFARPSGPQYPNSWDDRIRNYLIGWSELGLDELDVIDHFARAVGPEVTDRVVAGLTAERRNPFWHFDAIYCVNLDRRRDRWRQMAARFEQLGIVNRVRRFPAIETPEQHHLGRTLSYRTIIEFARQQSLEQVLVVDDDVEFLPETQECLQRSLCELDRLKWDVCYLGGRTGDRASSPVGGCEHLETADSITAAPAVGFHRRVFDRILGDLPGTAEPVDRWATEHQAIDEYLSDGLSDRRRFVTVPVIATRATIPNGEDPAG